MLAVKDIHLFSISKLVFPPTHSNRSLNSSTKAEQLTFKIIKPNCLTVSTTCCMENSKGHRQHAAAETTSAHVDAVLIQAVFTKYSTYSGI